MWRWIEGKVTEFEIGQAHSLVHLQCRIGTDTISWARRSLHVTGLDFSQSAIDEATQIASACAIASRWIRADVYDAVSALGETYDIVDTGKGALTWLHDIDRWAEVVTQLLNPDGRLYLVEFHPIAWTLDAENWSIVTDYFASEPVIEHEPQGCSAVPNVETRWNTTAQ